LYRLAEGGLDNPTRPYRIGLIYRVVYANRL
jgi:hypothetical protein